MLFLLLAVLGIAVASYYDVRYRIIPNWLTLPLFFAGVAGNMFLGNAKPLLASVGAMFLVGYSLWKLGFWSAGDAKEFLFLSALLPSYPQELKGFFNPYIAPYPFPITVFLNTFLASFPLVFLYAFYLTAKKTKITHAENLKNNLKKASSAAPNALFISALLVILSSLNLSIGSFYLSVPFVLLASAYLKSLKLKTGVAFFGLVLSLYYGSILPFLVSSAVIFLGIILFKIFWSSINFVSRQGLYDEIEIENLKEGMILAEEIYHEKIGANDKVIVGKNLYKRVMGGKDVIVSSAARGLEKEEIEKIKELAGEGKIEKRIMVKKSMSLAPALFGLGISLVFGDIAAMGVIR